VVRSVANLTHDDGRDFLAIAASGFIRTQTRTYPVDLANDALADLRAGGLSGAVVLCP
jgi:propanol-preferring alcohol dehydrogenase